MSDVKKQRRKDKESCPFKRGALWLRIFSKKVFKYMAQILISDITYIYTFDM